MRSQLDDEEYEVAAVTDKNVLVLAPPGSGKTRVLVNVASHRIRRAEELIGRPRARVLCLTFGNEAAREMGRRLQVPPLKVPPGRLWVGNYHALGAYLLRRYGHLLGWNRNAGLLPAPSNQAVVAEAAKLLGLRVNVADASYAISNLKGRRGVESSAAESLLRLRERYDELLRQRSLRDFDDLIVHTVGMLRAFPKVRQIIQDA